MDAETVALDFLRAFWASDIDKAMGFCAPSATWQFARSLPYARECSVREALERIRDDMFQSFDPEGFRIDMGHQMSAGNEVVVEYSAHGRTRDGRDYDNDYVMCITVQDGQVTNVRPHTDTLHLAHLLMGKQGKES
jgi:ketosteroid isomerase-like protein